MGSHDVDDSGDGARDIGDFIGLYIGTEHCSLFDIPQTTSFASWSAQCMQAREQ